MPRNINLPKARVFIRKDINEDTDNRLDKELSSRTGENMNEQDLEELVYENN